MAAVDLQSYWVFATGFDCEIGFQMRRANCYCFIAVSSFVGV